MSKKNSPPILFVAEFQRSRKSRDASQHGEQGEQDSQPVSRQSGGQRSCKQLLHSGTYAFVFVSCPVNNFDLWKQSLYCEDLGIGMTRQKYLAVFTLDRHQPK
eukprot:765275-Hanusia_phi.AAC.5